MNQIKMVLWAVSLSYNVEITEAISGNFWKLPQYESGNGANGFNQLAVRYCLQQASVSSLLKENKKEKFK